MSALWVTTIVLVAMSFVSKAITEQLSASHCF